MALRKNKARVKSVDATLWEGTVALFKALAVFYSLPPKPDPAEASDLLSLMLDQAWSGLPKGRFERLRDIWNNFADVENLLRSGWMKPKLKKKEWSRREQFAADVIVYVCSADSDQMHKFTRSLLSLTLPWEVAVDQWLSEARARLSLMEKPKDGGSDFQQLAQTLAEAEHQVAVNLGGLQDIPL